MIRLALAVGAVLWGAPAEATPLIVPAGTPVQIATLAELSSKTSRKGNPVAVETVSDVVIDGQVVIPKGTPGMAEVGDMRAKGMMGQRGKLSLRPLYLTRNGQTIRLSGTMGTKGTVEAGAIVGLALITPGFSGKSATIPAGTRFDATVMRETAIEP